MFGPADKGEVLFRNTENAKARRQAAGVDRSGRPSGASGAKARLRPTVKEEQRREAEKVIEATLARNPDHPVVKAWAARTAEIDKLQEALNPDIFEQADTSKLGTVTETKKPAAPKGRAPDASLRGLRLRESQLRTQIDEIKQTQKPIALERVNPESRYLPYTSAARSKPAGSFYGPTLGPYGIPVPGSMPELNHEFTGHYLHAGDFRVDATGLAGEAYGKTVRAVTKWNAWRRIWASSTPHRPAGKLGDYYEPVRDVSGVPSKLREIVNKASHVQLTSEEGMQLAEGELADLEKLLFPNAADLTPEEAQHVRWFDRRTIADERRSVPSSVGRKVKKGFQIINEPVRDFGIYAKPSYILNMINSASMALIDQGLFAIPNVYKAITAVSKWDPATARMLDAMAGESRTSSYAPQQASFAVSRALAAGWNKVTDQMFRRAAAIHWLHRAGIADEQIPAVLARSLKEPEAMRVVSEASRRAKKSMVELDNLTPVERDWLRHIVFVYPWTSRSLVWSLRTIAEHPIQSALYAEIGKETEQEFPPILKRLPGYMKEMGYFPIGWTKDGSPKMVNPGSVNTFATLAEFAGIADGTNTLDALLGPGAELALHVATNRDQYGRTYKTPVVGPVTDMLGGLPQYAAIRRAGLKPGETKPLDYTNQRALVEQENATLRGATKQPIFVPQGFWESFAPLAAGGLWPRVLDKQAVNARFWKNEPPAQRHEHERQLIDKMVTLQAGLLKRPVPHQVMDAVNLASGLNWQFKGSRPERPWPDDPRTGTDGDRLPRRQETDREDRRSEVAGEAEKPSVRRPGDVQVRIPPHLRVRERAFTVA